MGNIFAGLGEPNQDSAAGPGARLRQAAARLEEALRESLEDEIEAIAEQIERESYFAHQHLHAERPASNAQIAHLQENWRAALECHFQGWLALAGALECSNQDGCQRALGLAEQGDGILAEIEEELYLLRKDHPQLG